MCYKNQAIIESDQVNIKITTLKNNTRMRRNIKQEHMNLLFIVTLIFQSK